jgi:ADP-ribose pyrophosphatase YjhB (NUDIX family)
MTVELQLHIDKILEHVKNPKDGLPADVFYLVSQLTPLINVELLIKNKKGQTLLTWRDDRFYGPAWHIPGGIIRFKEKIEDRIEKVAHLELGATVIFAPDPIHIRGLINTERDIRGHFISMLYLCKFTTGPACEKSYKGGDPQQGEWAWHDQAPENLLKVHESFRKYIDETAPL